MGNKKTAWRHVQWGRVFPKGRNSCHGKRWVAPEASAGGTVVSHLRGQGRNLSAGRQEACQRLVQVGWLFPTPTPADTLLTGGRVTGVERRSESECGEIGGTATAPRPVGSRGTRGRSRVICSKVPDRGIRQEWETRRWPGGTCREVECFPKAEIRAMGNGGSRPRPVQEGWLFPTPTPADTLLTGGWATGVERRSESECGEIGGTATAPWPAGSRGTRGRSSVIGSIVPDRGIRQEWETRRQPGGTCSGVECFPKAEIRAMGNDGARLRPVQEGRLFPTPADRAGI